VLSRLMARDCRTVPRKKKPLPRPTVPVWQVADARPGAAGRGVADLEQGAHSPPPESIADRARRFLPINLSSDAAAMWRSRERARQPIPNATAQMIDAAAATGNRDRGLDTPISIGNPEHGRAVARALSTA